MRFSAPSSSSGFSPWGLLALTVILVLLTERLRNNSNRRTVRKKPLDTALLFPSSGHAVNSGTSPSLFHCAFLCQGPGSHWQTASCCYAWKKRHTAVLFIYVFLQLIYFLCTTWALICGLKSLQLYHVSCHDVPWCFLVEKINSKKPSLLRPFVQIAVVFSILIGQMITFV